MLRESIYQESVSYSAADVYRLLMIFSGLEPLKANILLVLTHIAPQQVSGAELTKLLGYSQKARTIYRGVLDDLQEDGFILVNKQGNQYSIGIDQSHPLVKKMYELVQAEGGAYTNQLTDLLGDWQ